VHLKPVSDRANHHFRIFRPDPEVCIHDQLTVTISFVLPPFQSQAMRSWFRAKLYAVATCQWPHVESVNAAGILALTRFVDVLLTVIPVSVPIV